MATLSEDVQKRINTPALNNRVTKEIHGIKTQPISPGVQPALHLVVDGSITVRKGHEVADDMRSTY